MEKEHLIEACDKIFNFWKLEEYFTPLDYPELILKIFEGKQEVPFDAYYNNYSTRDLPLNAYCRHNEYLVKNNKPAEKLYDRANVYCGCYKIKTFVEKMAEKCRLDMDKYAEINELSGRFYIFYVQIDLDGKLTEEGIQISPFFYAVVCMIKSSGIAVNITQEDIRNLNEDINEILKQNDVEIKSFEDIKVVRDIVFDKLGIETESQMGLEGASNNVYACKGLKKEEESSDFSSFYLEDIEKVQKNYKSNENIIKYTTALLAKTQKKTMIDSDVEAIKKWLSVDRFPMAKYPSRFSPTLMQQVAINIAISEEDRAEKIFSVNGPPGTGKTTLLKEIIASNVERLAETLIKYGLNSSAFVSHEVESASTLSYKEKYYEIPEEIAKFGILVVSNNNGAVENVTLDLPKATDLTSQNTRTPYFDRTEHEEVYFSSVADKLIGEEKSAWGLISARMGRKAYVSEVLGTCIFARKNDAPDKISLDLAGKNSDSWDEAVEKFKTAKSIVLAIRNDIKNDQEILENFYTKEKQLADSRFVLQQLLTSKEQLNVNLNEIKTELEKNEKETVEEENEINYIKEHASILNKLLIFLKIGKLGKIVAQKQQRIEELVVEHEDIKKRCNLIVARIEDVCKKIDDQNRIVSTLQKEVHKFEEKVFGEFGSLKCKYKNNLADRDFYKNIKDSEDAQNACPWTYAKYDEAREKLFYASLQVRKAFILNSPYIKRNLFVYEAYNNGRYTNAEKKEMFPHLFNALSVVIPVLSSTFASVGRFLKYAGNSSLGMLIIDESGQAVPQSALGALYRTKQAVVVGDPLQVEPVVTIPKVLIDILADSVGVSREYKVIENSAQTFADSVNEFNGMIGERQVGCPLVVHRRCIEPMFSISNMISYDNRMFNKTYKKEEYLKPEQPFLIKKSGWIQVEGAENGGRDHFVKNQAEKVCQLIENAIHVYSELFETDDKIFIITPFRTVADSMRNYIVDYFWERDYDKQRLKKWTNNCIGTVHTFQGKDANEVIFVLGCSDRSVGAMNWVVSKANILNVACTRAKYRIVFVGNIDNWKNRKYFNEFIPNFIDVLDI